VASIEVFGGRGARKEERDKKDGARLDKVASPPKADRKAVASIEVFGGRGAFMEEPA